MEKLDVKFNDITRFDEVIQNCLPDGGDLEIITKDAGTKSGRGIVMFTFSVEVDGKLKRAQTVTTIRMFRAISNAISQTYDDEGFRVNMTNVLDDSIVMQENIESYRTNAIKCEICNGTGKVNAHHDDCMYCNGTGEINKKL